MTELLKGPQMSSGLYRGICGGDESNSEQSQKVKFGSMTKVHAPIYHIYRPDISSDLSLLVEEVKAAGHGQRIILTYRGLES